MNNTIVVIPTYNEVNNIENLVSQILGLDCPVDILVVDDNSPDGTGNLLDTLSCKFKQVQIIHRKNKSGLGTAYIEGFNKALACGYEYVIQMDGDLSHNPKYIPDFLNMMKDFDLILGSRFLNGVHIINWSFSRLFLSLLAIKYVKFITRLPFTDPLGGFRCFRANALREIIADGLISKGYLFQVEVLYRSYKKGHRIGEAPIYFVNRKIGKSKLSLGIILEAIFKIITFRMKI